MKDWEPEDRLLTGIFTGEEPADLRADSLVRALGAIRRRKQRRLTGLCLAGVAVALAVALGPGIASRRAASKPRVEILRRAAVGLSARAEHTPGITLITDEELAALLPGRSFALIGKPGHQQLVFLAGKGRSAQ